MQNNGMIFLNLSNFIKIKSHKTEIYMKPPARDSSDFFMNNL